MPQSMTPPRKNVDSEVLGPPLDVAPSMRPGILTRDGLTLEGITTAKEPDLGTPDGAPIEVVSRAALDAGKLTGSQVAVAAAG